MLGSLWSLLEISDHGSQALPFSNSKVLALGAGGSFSLAKFLLWWVASAAQFFLVHTGEPINSILPCWWSFVGSVCIDFLTNFKSTFLNHFAFTLGCYLFLLFFVGSVYKKQTMHRFLSCPVLANFLTTLCSHLDVACSYYFWSNLRMNVVHSYSCSFS